MGGEVLMEKIILFDEFEVPIIKGLEYLSNEKIINSDYLFINESNDGFSMYFDKEFPVFNIPENSERNYCLFELKRNNKNIKFFCPEKQKNINSAVWYFYLEMIDERGVVHTLPGQVRVIFDGISIFQVKGVPKLIDVLDKVKIHKKLII